MATPRQKLEIATPEQFEGATLMRVIERNYKIIRYVDISLDQTLTVIGGDNGQGKSTFIEGIITALSSKDEIKIDEPIRRGEREGMITLHFGDGENVTLKITKNLHRVGEDRWGQEYDIEIPGYLPPSRTAEFIAKLGGSVGFDPIAFDAMTDAEQVEVFKKFVDFDFDGNTRAHDKIKEERTDVNRDLKRMQAAADSIAVAAKAPCERVDEDELTRQLQQAGENNIDLLQRKKNRSDAESRVDELKASAQIKLEGIDAAIAETDTRLESEVGEIDAEIERLQAKKAKLTADANAKRASIRADASAEAANMTKEAAELQQMLDAAPALPEAIDTLALKARLDAGRASNKLLSEWESARDRKRDYQKEADELTKQSEELTAQIVTLKQAREDAIRKAHLPIDGLGIGDGFVTLNGFRYKEGSEAQRMAASAAIGMALNPILKFMLIRAASGVGTKIRQQMTEIAAAGGYRVILEQLDEIGDRSHVLLQDGAVVGLQDRVPA